MVPVGSTARRQHEAHQYQSGLTRLTTSRAEQSDLRLFERDVHDGLSRVPKALPSLYFYDSRGSELFRKIMELPEYYLTRAEREILELQGARIAAPFEGQECDVVDLGAGDGAKTRILLHHLSRAGARLRYLPVDVSDGALCTVLGACGREMPWLETEGVVAEYEAGIRWLSKRDADRSRLVLFLGSNVGNLDDERASGFFRSLYDALRPGDHVLVGFDLVKDVNVILPAYDDAAGVTAEFNLNLLGRINRELGGTFQKENFRHFATYSPQRRAMESYLMSRVAQTVRVGRKEYCFEAWETLHTEISRKYRESDVAAFATEAGFEQAGVFFDTNRHFVDALWRVGPRGAER